MAEQVELFNGAAATPKRRAARQQVMAKKQRTVDSFQNFSLNLGLGTDNALTGSTYGFNPVTRIRTLLEWIYRGSWMGSVAVDIIADDMTREGVEIVDPLLKPDDIERMDQDATTRGVWTGINDTEKWARLYGGAIGVIMVDGQDPATPLRIDTIRPGQFKGILPLDRWMVTPSAYLVNEQGRSMGMPVSYTVDENAPGFRGKNIHYSRCIRLVGIELPWNQRISENMWGLSIIERIYDRMIAFDSATQGAAQLIYKSALRTYKVDGMREIMAMGGGADMVMVRYAEMVRKFQGIEGMTLIDSKDDMVTEQISVQSGISDALMQFAQQLSGALQIPLTRLLGQSPAGLNSTGESDLRTYYDNINKQQKNELMEPMTTVYRVIAASNGIKLSDKFRIKFRPLWQLTEAQKSEVAERDARSVGDLFGAGVIKKAPALRELRQVGYATGRFQNITDQDIVDAEKDDEAMLPPGAEEVLHNSEADETTEQKRDRRAATGDGMRVREIGDLQIAIETRAGDMRRGNGWAVEMPADYGYIRGTSSAEGPLEQMDCFVGALEGSPMAYVFDMAKLDNTFDESKVCLGFQDRASATACIRAAYQDAREPIGVTTLSIPELKIWMRDGDLTRPLSAQQSPPMLYAVR